MRSALSNAGVAADRVDSIMGWSGQNRGRAAVYGEPPPVSLLADAINMVDFGLNFAGARRNLSWH
jgi:hypothetical protein